MNRTTSKRPILWAVAAAIAVPAVAHADEVPADKQAVVLARALAYDEALKGRAGDAVVVGVLFKEGNPASEKAADSMMAAWKAVERVKIQGLPVKSARLPFSTSAALQAAVESQGVDALYVCAGLEKDVAAIKEVSRKKRVVSIASREEQIGAGLALGVFAVDGKSTIKVNLPASREEGAAFSGDLLRLAKVVK